MGYLEDASGFRGYAERLFVPATGEELAEVLRLASGEGVAVTIAGAGTGVTGGRVALGGWVVSTEKLTRLEIQSGRATAGAGVALHDLHAAAARSGQFYPPDPTETWASVGGTVATNASGSRSFRYGDTRGHVLALRVAFPDGRLAWFQRGQQVDFPIPNLPLPRTTKHTAGFRLRPGMDWVDLFVGSEGTLGVVTEAELGLLPQPECLLAGVAFLPDDHSATVAVEAWRGVGGLRMLEYLDRGSLGLLRGRFPDVPAGAGAAILFEQEVAASHEASEIDSWVARFEAAHADHDSSWFAAGAADRERFRRFRHALPETVNDTVRRNGFPKLGSDYAVPLARNRDMLDFYRHNLEDLFPGRYVIFGHIGDAHLHVNILPATGEEFERGKELMLHFARQAVALGGTVSAEHGLGKRKRELLEIQYTPGQVEAMRQVKTRLDPNWLLGRGNLFAPPDSTG